MSEFPSFYPISIRLIAYACLICMLSVSVLSGCAQLPLCAQPRLISIEGQSSPAIGGFTYRELTRSDFAAVTPPPDIPSYGTGIYARSCIRIRPIKGARPRVVPQYHLGKIHYFGTVQNIAFEAVMIPSCSWWNPNVPEEKVAGLLQHEQIHFAISEIAARQLTQKIKMAAGSLQVIHETRQAALDHISFEVNAIAEKAMQKNLKKHTAFDKDTSLRFDARRQQWWYDRVEEDLRKSRG